jgi:hypothetical protein
MPWLASPWKSKMAVEVLAGGLLCHVIRPAGTTNPVGNFVDCFLNALTLPATVLPVLPTFESFKLCHLSHESILVH